MNNRPSYFFCIGVQKTGTTVLARLLDQHPRIACVWESWAFKPRAPASLFNPRSDAWRKHGFAEADIRRWSRRWGGRPVGLARRLARAFLGRDPLGSRRFAATMAPLLDDFARRCQASVVGDKWPQYIDFLPETLAALPDARFIYNVRDPRGLWNSAERFKDRGRGEEILAEMLAKDRRVRPYLARANFLTVRYEDLVLRPEETMPRLYDFLGCDYNRAYLAYDRARDPYPARWDWVPQASGPLDPHHVFKWQRQLPADDQAHIASLAADFMTHYGYD